VKKPRVRTWRLTRLQHLLLLVRAQPLVSSCRGSAPAARATETPTQIPKAANSKDGGLFYCQPAEERRPRYEQSQFAAASHGRTAFNTCGDHSARRSLPEALSSSAAWLYRWSNSRLSSIHSMSDARPKLLEQGRHLVANRVSSPWMSPKKV